MRIRWLRARSFPFGGRARLFWIRPSRGPQSEPSCPRLRHRGNGREVISGAKSKLRLLRVLRDEAMIESARDEATALIEQDPTLRNESELAKALAQLESDTASEFIDRG